MLCSLVPAAGFIGLISFRWLWSKWLEQKQARLLQVHLHGKVGPFQDDVFVVNGSGQTTLSAEAGMAVITLREGDECYFQTMSVST